MTPFSGTQDSTERALLRARGYLHWNARCWAQLNSLDRQTYGHQLRGDISDRTGALARLQFTKSFHDACHLLVSGRNVEAFARLNDGCGYVREYLAERSFLIFIQVLRLYSYQFWAKVPDLRRHLLQFFARMAFQTLPIHNPFRDLLRIMCDDDALSTGIECFVSLVTHEYSANGCLSAQDSIWIQDEMAFRYYQLCNFDEALRVARGLAEDVHVPLEVSSKAMCLMGQCYIRQRRFDEAKSVLLQAVDLCQRCYHRQGMDVCFFSTLFDLGVLSETTGEHAQCVEYYCRALDVAQAAEAFQCYAVADLYTYVRRLCVRFKRYDKLHELDLIYGSLS